MYSGKDCVSVMHVYSIISTHSPSCAELPVLPTDAVTGISARTLVKWEISCIDTSGELETILLKDLYSYKISKCRQIPFIYFHIYFLFSFVIFLVLDDYIFIKVRFE